MFASFSDADSKLRTYITSLPPYSQSLLDKELDWDSEGVDKDLFEIAKKMIHWEEKGLHTLLGLCREEIHDIKQKWDEPVLQRWVK